MNIKELIDNYPKELDLTNDENAKHIEEAVEYLLNHTSDIKELEGIEEELIDTYKEQPPIFVLLAIKIAKRRGLFIEKSSTIGLAVFRQSAY